MKKLFRSLFCIAITLFCLGASAQTFTFPYTGGLQTWTTPGGVTSISVSMQGAKGGLNSIEAYTGCSSSLIDREGYGACVVCTLAVTPGQLLNIYVGGRGGDGTRSACTSGTGGAGGYNGGGAGRYAYSPYAGGGGGGASDIRIGGTALTDRKVIAAGGGGAGANYFSITDAERGGDGGGTTGEAGYGNSTPAASGGASGGTSGGGGAGGVFVGYAAGGAGTLGVGGGGTLSTTGGGGGGGYYGGGGGCWGGGGGGSSYTDATLATSVSHTRGCNSTGDGQVIITVNCSAGLITGNTTICLGTTTTLIDTVGSSSGTWSSSNTAVATVGATTGIVTAVTTGTTMITYSVTLPCGSVYSTAVVTVNPLPLPITGTTNVCVGRTTTLSDPVSGGIWTSGTTSVATVGSGTGVVTGVTAGTSVITYSVGAGSTCMVTTTVLVNPLPVAIAGTTSVCLGLTSTLTDATPGGTWSSTPTTVATVGSGTGIVTGVSIGTAFITYTLSTGCIATTIVTVNPLPAAITGTLSVCKGLTTTLADVTTGGTWSSGTTSVATIGSSTGIATGVSAGTSIITYMLTATGCISTAVLTVNPLPATITGPTSVCAGSTITLADVTPGGTWSSSTTSVATIGSSTGIVSGVGAGVTTITYTLPTGCIMTTVITVNPLPFMITGLTTVCAGSTTLLADGTPGGTWSSGNTAIATVVSGSGLVTGVTAGTAAISYTLATGCYVTVFVTVNPLPAPITGSTTLCEGGFTSLLSDATPGGTWSSSDPSVATIVSSTGVLTSVLAGTTIITYALTSTGCLTTTIVTVNPTPSPITGATSICLGKTALLTDLSPGGIWTSSNTSVATAGSLTGIVTGVALGIADITYTLATGCLTTITVFVYPNPAAITGTTSFCLGGSSTLADATPGGTWSSSNTAVAPVIPTVGLVTGVGCGTAVITYTLSTGCYSTTTVNILCPSAITGTTRVCVGSCSTLSNTLSGGSWTSSNTSVATIGSGTGTFCGVAVGTAIITYSISGCRVTTSVTVSANPAAIGGSTSICIGNTTTLTNATSGGSWNSSNTSVATVGSGTGVVGGVASGTTTITYMMAAGCYATITVTVNAAPTAITGTLGICLGSTSLLGNGVGGGTWSSSNTAIATIGTSTGLVTSVAAGTTIITYSLGGGCRATAVVTVYPLPTAISGSSAVCAGSTITLSSPGGGTWISSNTSVATVTSGGVVSGVTLGTTIITYTLPTGCATTTTVTVSPTPTPITGITSICTGLTTTLTDGVGGGLWSSSNTAVATAGSTTGIITGVTAGTSRITYSLGSGCLVTTIVTIYASPTAISGPSALCAGTTMTLTDGVAGGTWFSSNTAVATVVTGTGFVSAIALGTTIITYTLPGGCIATKTITVSPVPAAITGPSTICTGTCTLFTDAVPGGLWTSSNPAVATAGSTSGDICGVTTGTAIITYSLGTGCTAFKTISVIASPSAISGAASVCVGSTTLYTDPTSGGTWSSGSTSIATVTSTGTVTGVAAGTAIISYTMASGCYAIKMITVTPVPTPITGTGSVCVGQCLTLADAVPGGTWSSSSTAIATAGPSGTVCGVAAGTATITYSFGGCYATTVVTITPMPSAIGGSTGVGVGGNTTLTNTVSGGTWSSSDGAIATIGASTGIAGGVAVGTVTITYMLPTGCYVTTVLNVNTSPCAMAPASVCTGSCITLSQCAGGGTWSSSNTAVASITPTSASTASVCGLTAGTSVITYTLGSCSGCTVTTTVTVNRSPGAITGAGTICAGQSTGFTVAIPGGTWSSSTTTVATTTTTGTIFGAGAGTSVITYTLPGGCFSTKSITVTPTPGAIGGPSAICANNTTTLTNPVSGGVWTSSNVSAASITSSTGDLYPGVTGGSTTITYAIGTCIATKVITVNPIGPITGSTNVCVGTCTTLADAVPGGAWSSGSTAIATVAAGVVCGASTGTTTITYAMPTGCLATTTVTVNALPSAIGGSADVCVGSCTAQTNATSGGAWSSSNTAVASIDATGTMCGVSAGTARITYSIGSGCYVTRLVTVNPLPGIISGTPNVCQGSTTVLASATAGGTWSSSNTGVATITIGGTTVFGVSPGTSMITYTLPTGCYRTFMVTVNPLPASIAGALQVCVGSCSALTSTTAGGTWSTGTAGIATVSSSGNACGASVGVTPIIYTLATGCKATANFTVTPSPSAIAGPSHICQGSTGTMTNLVSGGVWSSSNSSIASINASTGVVTALSSGTVLINYVLGSGCSVVTALIVDPVVPITGPTTVCVGQTAILIDTALGGTWTTSSSAIATATGGSGGIGIVTGVAAGAVTITYALPTGCITTYRMVVNPIPPAITGTTSVCQGQSTVLADSRLGGTWNSSNASIASLSATTPSPATATIYGAAAGTSTISYTIGGCAAMVTFTVNPLPMPIGGVPQVCVAGTTALTDLVPGGTWTTGAASVASVNGVTGVVTGMAPGTANITYTIGTGCYVTTVVTVYPNPLPITGASNLCVSYTTALSDATPGGTWSSLNTTVATVDAAGIVYGVTSGTATIVYSLATGCYVSMVVNVNPLPPAITGPAEVCEGATITLANAIPGGTWSSTPTSIATAGTSSGIITGVSAGVATIVYTVGTGCVISTNILVNPIPLPITGSTNLCVTSTTSLSDATPGGIWSSSNAAVASIDATGLVSGLTVGTATITYQNPVTSCYITQTVNVSPFPSSIGGNTNICLGSTNVLTNTVPGGSWFSIGTSIATANSATGAVTGLSVGSTVIVYTLGSGCTVTTPVNVLPLPASFTITGGGNFCAGGTGVHIGLSGSQVGTTYYLYIGSTALGTFAGTGSALDFGLQTVPGTYRVVAVNTTTTCSLTMMGTASVVADPFVTPAVGITIAGGDTVCAGTSTMFTADTTNAGTTPTYVWKVNGVNVSIGNVYSFIPANGDVVTVEMTSSAHCATPAVVTHSVSVTVKTHELPVSGLSANPGDTVCAGMAVTLTSTPTFGGPAPIFYWFKNNVQVASGPVYSYIPSNGDIVYSRMVSNYFCRTVDTVSSSKMKIKVITPDIPNVTISASPGTTIGAASRTVTFTANVTDAGDAPTYQWYINSIPMAGETSRIFIHSGFSTIQDSVSCEVTSSGICPIASHGWVYININQLGVKTQQGNNSSLTVLPNPSNGSFTIKGSLGSVNDEAVSLEITDMLGQVVYSVNVATNNGNINERVQLRNIANGMYLLNVRTETEHRVFHIVVEQ